MIRRKLPLILVTALVALPLALFNVSLAHDDDDEALYVAEGGIDRGRCLDKTQPCGTIGYALAAAGKGAQLRVAMGRYSIDDTSELFHLVSGMIDVLGGFDPQNEFRRSDQGRSVLIGVPAEYRDMLRSRGFHVIADRKSIEGPAAADTERLLGLHARLKAGAAPGPCVDGSTGDLDCDAVDLLSHFAFDDLSARPGSATDVWGFQDRNSGREYALVAYDIGTAVVDVTDPASPLEVGFVHGQPAAWRDVKVYQVWEPATQRWHAYAYVATDGSTDGLFVLDLGDLPHRVHKLPYQSDFLAAHNLYITNTDYRSGIALTDSPPLLVVAGSDLASGRYRAYTLADPANPEFVSSAAGPDYMHDATSLMITDERKDTQCVNAATHCEVLVDFNEDVVDLWDISDASNPVRLSRSAYPNAAYVHSGWWSEDRRYLFVHDELDEQNRGLRTTVRVFSIDDLRSPVAVGSWSGPTAAIDHNGYVRGNRYYMSNYSRGLTVLDISSPEAPVTAARLDTYPFSDNTGFVGAWGAYPFFDGNKVALSDIDSGLYMARDRSVEVPQGRFSFSAASFAAREGQSALLTVERVGGAAGAVSVSIELLHATSAPGDVDAAGLTFSWADGDAGAKTVALPVRDDGAAESLELLFARLVTPTGGAALGSRDTASVYLEDGSAGTELRLLSDTVTVTERGFGMAVVVLQRTGSAIGAASVDWATRDLTAVRNEDYLGPASGTVAWDDGDAEPKTLVFDLVDDGSHEEDELFEIVLENPVAAAITGPATALVTIQNGSGPNRSPTAVAGSSQVRAPGSTVTLDGRQSNDPDGDSLSYHWVQTGGTAVSLDGAQTAVARFNAPDVGSETLLRFRLTVTDPAGLSDTSSTTVTVRSSDAGGGGGGSGGGAANAWWLLALLWLALRLRSATRTGAA